MKIYILILSIFLLLSSCTYEKECFTDSDCETPFEYLVQSNCPFDSACIKNKCHVVCPFSYHDPNQNISKSYPMPCNKDSDCNCSNRANSIDCICHDGGCLSVEN
jgi:hypothetical protein